MMLVHIARPLIVLVLDDGLEIVQVWRVRKTYVPVAGIKRLSTMRSSPNGIPSIEGNTYVADGLGAIVLVLWLLDDPALWAPRALLRAFYKLFEGDCLDALKAGLRGIICNDPGDVGEDAFFSREQWRNHPTEMAALAAAYRLWRQSNGGEQIGN